MTDWTVTVKYANYVKQRVLGEHLTPDTFGISSNSGVALEMDTPRFFSGLDIGLSVAFQARTHVLNDFLIDACGDLDSRSFSR